MPTSFQLRRGTYYEWQQKNPRLRAGEMGFEIGSNRYKIGDGLRSWVDLPYFQNDEVTKQYIDAEIAGIVLNVDGVTQLEFDTHVDSDAPHLNYDDGRSLVVLYENAKA